MTVEPVTYPMQNNRQSRESPRIVQSVNEMAYEVYAHCYGEQPTLKTGGRGGFGVGEVIAFLYARNFPKNEWYDRTKEAFKGMVT